MLRFAGALVLGLAVLGLSVGAASADDKKADKKAGAKEETLKGVICCAKCELKKADKCATVLKVKKDDKETLYYFDQDSHKKHHSKYCTGTKEATVTAKVTEKDGKKWIAVSKIEDKKKDAKN